MEVKEKVTKEVEEIVGYQCDICKNPIEKQYMTNLNTVKYTVLEGGYGERSATKVEHVCSVECLKKSIRNAWFGADVFLSRDLIEKLISK